MIAALSIAGIALHLLSLRLAHGGLGAILDVALDELDTLLIYPHYICPVDGMVTEGRGLMDDSYLTGEPFQISKTQGSAVISARLMAGRP